MSFFKIKKPFVVADELLIKEDMFKKSSREIRLEIFTKFPKNLLNILSKYHTIIAGGYLTSKFFGTPTNDIDIFFRSEKDLNNAYDDFLGEKHFYEKVNTQNAISFFFGGNFQLIKVIYGEPLDIIKSFDLSPCQVAFDFKDQSFYKTKDFEKTFGYGKEMIYNIECKTPLLAFFRIKKYIDKGFTIREFELLKISLLIASLGRITYRELNSILSYNISGNVDMCKEIKEILSAEDFQDEIFKMEEFLLLLKTRGMFSDKYEI